MSIPDPKPAPAGPLLALVTAVVIVTAGSVVAAHGQAAARTIGAPAPCTFTQGTSSASFGMNGGAVDADPAAVARIVCEFPGRGLAT